MPELEQPWDFAGCSTRNGESERLYDIELVQQDLLNHFYTRQGELDWAPNYGSVIPDMLFETRNDRSQNIIEDDVRRIINSDQRVSLQEITVEVLEHGYNVEVVINYLGRNPPILMQIEFDRRNFNEV